VIAISLSILYYLLADATSQYIYHQESLLLPLSIAAGGVLGGSLLDFINSVLQGEQKYSRLAFIKMLEGSLKLGGLIILVLLKIFSINLVFLLYTIVPIFIFLFGTNLRKWEKLSYDFKEIFSELYNFSKWIFLTSLITMVMSRLDIIMLSFLKSNDYNSLGIYSAGLKLGVPLLVATGSMITVYYPKAMTLSTKNEIRKYVSQTLKTTIPISLGFVCFWSLIEILIPIYFNNYIDSLPIFRILLIAYIFTLIGNPITLLMFVINKQKVATLINTLQLVINIPLNLVFYKYFDISGIALGTLITYFIGGVLTFQYLLRYFRKSQYLFNASK
jgi:O-antigen/teichoic acid export membrane protein